MKCIIAAALVLASACAPAVQASGGDGREALEAAVYAVVIDSLLASPRVPFVVIADSTMQLLGSTVFDGSLTPIQSDFLARNREPRGIPARLPAGTRVRRLRYAAHRQGDRYAAFQRFRREYAPVLGFYVLSRPGFADDGRQAMLTVTRGCEAYCTVVEMVTLDSQGGRWRILEHRLLAEF